MQTKAVAQASLALRQSSACVMAQQLATGMSAPAMVLYSNGSAWLLRTHVHAPHAQPLAIDEMRLSGVPSNDVETPQADRSMARSVASPCRSCERALLELVAPVGPEGDRVCSTL
jgi:hypothetical protein